MELDHPPECIPDNRYLHTAPEIIGSTDGEFDGFCDFVGSGGSFAERTATFKDHKPAILCFVVEPADTAVLAGKPLVNANHRIQGGGYSMTQLPLLKRQHIDCYMRVIDEEAIRTARRLAREEGIFSGFSSGANVAAALARYAPFCSTHVTRDK